MNTNEELKTRPDFEKMKHFGVVEPPDNLVLKELETIEWVVNYKKEGERENSFLIHALTAESAEQGVKKLFGDVRILKISYYGTYQY